MKKIRNINYRAVVAMVVVCFCFSLGISAVDNDSSWEPGRTCDWSPHITDDVAEGMINHARARTDFIFTNAAYVAFDETNYDFTFEHNTSEDYDISVEDHFTNLPNPTFDTDDDSGDGYDEEAEVNVAHDDIDYLVDYYYATWWNRPSTLTVGGFTILAQLSSYFFGEYQAMASDFYENLSWEYNFSRSIKPFTPTSPSLGEKNIINTVEKVFRSFDNINTYDALVNYKNETEQQFYTALSDSLNSDASDAETLERFNAVLTFTEPMNLSFINDIVIDDCYLVGYEVKFTNSENEWLTMYSKRTDFNELMYVANELYQGNDLEFCGLTSAIINMPADNDVYTELANNDNIFLVDTSEYIIKSQNPDKDIKIIVSDCYYNLETAIDDVD